MDHFSGRLPISLFEGGEAPIFAAAVREIWSMQKHLQHITTICCGRWWLFPMYWFALFWSFTTFWELNKNLISAWWRYSRFWWHKVTLMSNSTQLVTKSHKRRFAATHPLQANPGWEIPTPPAIIGNWPGLKWHPVFWPKIFLGIFAAKLLECHTNFTFQNLTTMTWSQMTSQKSVCRKRSWNYCRAILWKALWTQRLAWSKPPEFFRFFQLQVQVFPPCSPKKQPWMPIVNGPGVYVVLPWRRWCRRLSCQPLSCRVSAHRTLQKAHGRMRGSPCTL